MTEETKAAIDRALQDGATETELAGLFALVRAAGESGDREAMPYLVRLQQAKAAAKHAEEP